MTRTNDFYGEYLAELAQDLAIEAEMAAQAELDDEVVEGWYLDGFDDYFENDAFHSHAVEAGWVVEDVIDWDYDIHGNRFVDGYIQAYVKWFGNERVEAFTARHAMREEWNRYPFEMTVAYAEELGLTKPTRRRVW